MSDCIGNAIKLTLFGESHGETMGATLSNIPSGIKIDEDYIKNELAKRRPLLEGETPRIEEDDFSIISGVYNGFTTGSSLTLLMKNVNHDSSSYEHLKGVFRPSHADYVANIKYDGFNDPRGGGHFSGRLTAPLVAICAILKKALEDKGIIIGSRISQIGDIKDKGFTLEQSIIESFNDSFFPVYDDDVLKKYETLLKDMTVQGDSVGGEIETYVLNLEVGLGQPFFDSLESQLSHLMFSIPALKGISFGLGQDFISSKGSSVNDEFVLENNKVVTTSNNNGGINGGISNGMPVIFKSVIKPTPSIKLPQHTLRDTLEEVEINIHGRHDSCLARRIVPVINALTAFVIFDNYMMKDGERFLK